MKVYESDWQRFYERVLDEPELHAALRKAESPEDLIQMTIALASELGFTVSRVEIEQTKSRLRDEWQFRMTTL